MCCITAHWFIHLQLNDWFSSVAIGIDTTCRTWMWYNIQALFSLVRINCISLLLIKSLLVSSNFLGSHAKLFPSCCLFAAFDWSETFVLSSLVIQCALLLLIGLFISSSTTVFLAFALALISFAGADFDTLPKHSSSLIWINCKSLQLNKSLLVPAIF